MVEEGALKPTTQVDRTRHCLSRGTSCNINLVLYLYDFVFANPTEKEPSRGSRTSRTRGWLQIKATHKSCMMHVSVFSSRCKVPRGPRDSSAVCLISATSSTRKHEKTMMPCEGRHMLRAMCVPGSWTKSLQPLAFGPRAPRGSLDRRESHAFTGVTTPTLLHWRRETRMVQGRVGF